MSIPNYYLDAWAKQPSSEKAKNTYHRFKEIAEKTYGSRIEIYLQGSYANDTNIKGESDVDIVLCFNDVIINNTLSGYEFYKPQYSHGIEGLRDDVFDKLNNSFNFSLTKGSKTIKYGGGEQYLPVDLVPCAQYKGLALGNNGIAIYDHENKRTYVNYPKIHIKNSETKNGDCSGNYKKAVRMFKRAKEELLSLNMLKYASIAPSYFVESLLYNVPNRLFVYDNSQTFINVLTWLDENKYGLSNLKCPNGRHYLFEQGYTGSNGNFVYKTWNIGDAITFINALVNLWKTWR